MLIFSGPKSISMKTLKAWNVKSSADSFSYLRQHLVAEHAYCIVHKYI